MKHIRMVDNNTTHEMMLKKTLVHGVNLRFSSIIVKGYLAINNILTWYTHAFDCKIFKANLKERKKIMDFMFLQNHKQKSSHTLY